MYSVIIMVNFRKTFLCRYNLLNMIMKCFDLNDMNMIPHFYSVCSFSINDTSRIMDLNI